MIFQFYPNIWGTANKPRRKEGKKKSSSSRAYLIHPNCFRYRLPKSPGPVMSRTPVTRLPRLRCSACMVSYGNDSRRINHDPAVSPHFHLPCQSALALLSIFDIPSSEPIEYSHCQFPFQRFNDLLSIYTTALQDAIQHGKCVGGSSHTHHLHSATGSFQFGSVTLPFVPQRVHFGGEDQRWC